MEVITLTQTTITIKATGPHADYAVELKHKLTIITGDSATGKTGFVQTVANNLAGSYGYTYLSYTKVLIGTNINMRDLLVALNKCTTDDAFVETVNMYNPFNYDVWIFDEDVKCINTRVFAKLVKLMPYHFIVVSRDTLSNLTYDYTAIFKFKRSGKFHTLSRIYPDINFERSC